MNKSVAAVCLLLSVAAAGPAGAADYRTQIIKGALKIDPSKFQRRLIPAAVAGKGCTFYEHENGGGKSWHKAVGWFYGTSGHQASYAEYVAYVGDWWNDRISSIRCDDSANVHCYAVIYPDADKGGEDAAFGSMGGTVNLGGSKWNDAVSSFVIYCTKVG